MHPEAPTWRKKVTACALFGGCGVYQTCDRFIAIS